MPRSLLPLVLLLLIAAGAAVWLNHEPDNTSMQSSLLFADLAPKAQDLDRVVISNQQGIVLEAVRKDGVWMARLDGLAVPYPVDAEQLSAMVQQLVDAKRIEAKTNNPDNHSVLGLSDIAQADSRATLVELATQQDTWQLLVGQTASSGMGSYVRLPRQNQTWLVDIIVSLPRDAQRWLDHNILPVSVGDVASLELSGPTALHLSVDEETQQAVLDGMPEQATLRYPRVLDNWLDSVVSVDFEQVEARTPVAQDASVQQYTLQLRSGTPITFTLIDDEDGAVLRVDGEQRELWQQVQYRLSAFAAGQLRKTMDDFISLPEEGEAEQPVIPMDEGEAPQ